MVLDESSVLQTFRWTEMELVALKINAQAAGDLCPLNVRAMAQSRYQNTALQKTTPYR
jgi:hypothetical protein